MSYVWLRNELRSLYLTYSPELLCKLLPFATQAVGIKIDKNPPFVVEKSVVNAPCPV